MHSYDLEVLAKDNVVLTILNLVVMAQLEHMNLTMNAMQAQLKTLVAAPTDHICFLRGNTTVGFAEANIIKGVKPAPPRNPSI